MTDITWNKNGDDYTAIVGEYQLFVRFSKQKWEWVVTKPLPEVHSYAFVNGGKELSLESAKEAAVKAYNDHVNKSH